MSEDLSANANEIHLHSPKLQELLKHRVKYPTGKKYFKTAPIVLINDEFVQVYDYKDGKFKILRGVWSSIPQTHAKKSKVHIFPYQSLSGSKLK